MRPDIHFTLANKGVGPAILKNVIVKVDGEPVRNWAEAFEKILGPGKHPGSESDMSGHVFSAGESMTVLTPTDPNDNPPRSANAGPCAPAERHPAPRPGAARLRLGLASSSSNCIG